MPYKLLIVDDEIDVREGLFNTIDWKSLGFEAIAMAADGNEAIKKIEGIDVVISDIKMEGMNGIEFIDYLHNNHPNIKIVLISGYSDIVYYKKGIECKIFDYLLKPTSLDIFNKVFSTLKKELDKEQQKEKIFKDSLLLGRRQFLTELVSGLISDKEVYTNLTKQFNLSIESNNSELFLINTGLSESLPKIFETLIEDFTFPSYLELFYFENTSILGITNLPIPNVIEFLQDIATKFNNELYIGISSKSDDILNINSQFQETRLLVNKMMLLSKPSVLYFGQKENIKNNNLNLAFNNEKILNSLLIDSNEIWRKEINNIFYHFKKLQVDDFEYLTSICSNLYFEICKFIINKGLKVENMNTFIAKISSLETLEQKKIYFINKLESLRTLFVELKSENKLQLVKDIENIIRKEYQNQQISLSFISSLTGRNEAYISNLFKIETGLNINTLIVNLRIEKAKKLLIETNMKTYKISEAIGYSDCSYFTKLFKKTTGFSPIQYRINFR